MALAITFVFGMRVERWNVGRNAEEFSSEIEVGPDGKFTLNGNDYELLYEDIVYEEDLDELDYDDFGIQVVDKVKGKPN